MPRISVFVRLTPFSREALAQTVLVRERQTAAKWVRRYQREGRLCDRSSRPQHSLRRCHPAAGDLKKIGPFQAIGCRIYGNRRGRIYRAGWEYVHVAFVLGLVKVGGTSSAQAQTYTEKHTLQLHRVVGRGVSIRCDFGREGKPGRYHL